ncbi:hypothetical protein RLOC_00011860 [Lonchura striata]|uniref:Uncharacterized protein n=1 Tax=Lonchura striata TaxID=40157 RepID=A0A218V3R7_9PASE|nr:hypothetical protein RLOC_00011860 [Lonchura striata domestica]
MEKLLLKKYRRTPVDQFFASCMKDSRPVQALSVQHAGAGGGEKGDDDDDDIEELTDEEVKKYWASVYRAEESNTVSENVESSLKIEFLDDSEDLEESSYSSVEETGNMGMNKQGKTEPLECGRNPVSPKEISQEKLIVCSDLEINAVQEESVEPKAGRRSLSSCELPELSEPTEGVSKDLTGAELKSSRDLQESELQEGRREPQELGNVCSTQSLVLPVVTKSSAVSYDLQDVAKRQKCGSTSYQGLEGFFVGASPKQEKLEAPSSLAAASSPSDRKIPFPGDGLWVSERSLSEYADDSVVQGVLASQLSRAANAFQAQNQLSHLMAAWMPWPDISGPEKHSSQTCEDGTSSSRATEENSGNADLQSALELKDHDTLDIFGNKHFSHPNSYKLEASG